MRHRAPTCCRAVFAAAALLVAGTAGADATAATKSNTQLKFPGNAAIGDVDGDGLQDLVYPAGNRILATRVDINNTGILHGYLGSPTKRLIVGEFGIRQGTAISDQVCALMANGKMRCFRTSTDKRELWYAFQQTSFIGKGDHAIVADFTGDGQDDIMKYTPKTGALKLFVYQHSKKKFVASPGFMVSAPPNALVNKQLRAGKFPRRDRSGLVAWDKSTGVVSRFDITTVSGKPHAQHKFTTSQRAVANNETLHVANVDGSTSDSIALVRGDGHTRFFFARTEQGALVPNAVPKEGQLAAKGGGVAFFGHFEARDNEPGSRRDDVLFHTPSGALSRMAARWNPKTKKHTYWWAYNGPKPTVHKGWPKKRVYKHAVLKCAFKNGVTASLGTEAEFNNLYGYAGHGKKGMWDYFRDTSYGVHWISTKVWPGMKTVDKTKAQLDKRWKKYNACVDAWGVSTADYDTVIVAYNEKNDFGVTGKGAVIDDAALTRTDGVIHEIFHTRGLPHAFDTSGRKNASWAYEGQYYDEYDPMGGKSLLTGTGPLGKRTPHTNAFFKTKLGVLPSTRIRTISPGPAATKAVVKVAALERPEANGPLSLIVDLPGEEQLAVEFRDNWGWDAGFPRPTVLVRTLKPTPKPSDTGHPIRGIVPYLPRDAPGPELLAGESFSAGNVTIKVLSIDTASGRAHVEVSSTALPSRRRAPRARGR